MLPFSPACERNKEPIAERLREAFREVGAVLEIASGTGQHAVHFARALPHLTWQPTDREVAADGLAARIAAEAPANVLPPLALDVTRRPWPVGPVDGVFCANMIHIAPWTVAEHLFAGAGDVLAPDGTAVLYGPFRYGGAHTADSNAAFDADLRRRDPAWGIRDFEAVDRLAAAAGLRLAADHAMPANNRLIVWRREAAP